MRSRIELYNLMQSFNNRIDQLFQLTNDDVLKQIYNINQKIKLAFDKLPEFRRLYDLQKSLPNTSNDKFDIELILQHYLKYMEFTRNAIEINSMDLNKITTHPIDLTPIIHQKITLLRLSYRYMLNMIRSLILTEKFIKHFTQVNEFYIDIQEQLINLERDIK